jgi:hypothetical protein
VPQTSQNRPPGRMTLPHERQLAAGGGAGAPHVVQNPASGGSVALQDGQSLTVRLPQNQLFLLTP